MRSIFKASVFMVVGGLLVLLLTHSRDMGWLSRLPSSRQLETAPESELAQELDAGGTASPAAAPEDEKPAAAPGGKSSEDEPASGDKAEVRLTGDQIDLIGLKTTRAKEGAVVTELSLNGEVIPNQDKTAQILPRTSGIVREIKKQLGDSVRANDIIAVVESREISEAQAAYLAARSKAALAQTNFEREESLWKKKVSAEQDYLAARQAATEAGIEQRAAERKLTLLGVDPKIAGDETTASNIARVSIVAPFDGTLIEKDVAPGGQVTDQTAIFRIADLETVWVIASVFEQDVSKLRLGQEATVAVRAYPDRSFAGKVAWISEVIDEKSRTLKIRVELDNKARLLKPGSFAQVTIKSGSETSVLEVPLEAVQRDRDKTFVFVAGENGHFQRRYVEIGVRSSDAVQVVAGLVSGERVVTDGSFLLKSELEKGSFEEE